MQWKHSRVRPHFPILVALSLAATSTVCSAHDWLDAPLACYSVPAISSIQRLPDTVPNEDQLSTLLRVVAAQGEFEPASFVIAPKANVEKLELRASALSGPNGQIPSECIDMKIVKCWYQAGTAWYSYFGDSLERRGGWRSRLLQASA